MTTKKKLDKKTLENYKKLLLETKEKVTSDIKQISDDSANSQTDSSRDVSGHALHIADVATDMYDREFNLGLASNDREILQKIDAALKRIQDGTYGFCLKTGKAIPAARLKAIPYAEYCLEVQQEIDSKK